MEKIETFAEVIMYLKDGEFITANGRDTFYLKNNLITHKFNGNSIKISYDDFLELYRDKDFYLKEENKVEIDQDKDKDYYERYRK